MDEPHPAYDFFALGPLPGYDGNPNNMNGWIEADVPLLGDLGEITEPIVEVEEQMVTLVMDVEEDLAVLFGNDDDSGDDDSEGPEDDEEDWEIDEEWLMAPVTPPPMPVMPSPSTFEVGGPSTTAAEGHSYTILTLRVPVPPLMIEDLCTRMGNLKYGHGLLVKKVITVSDAEVDDSIAIGEIGPRVSTMVSRLRPKRDETIKGLSQQVQTLQAVVQHRDVQIWQLQTLVVEMSSRESTLMQCILGLDRRLADLERRPPGPQ
ncbi:hypothetical protein Tco_0223828 [Tanacetum coccineum]